MSFWIFIIALSAMTLFLLSMPIWRRPVDEADRADFDLTIFKDQIKELERDQERGLISENEAETARLEIQRRMLSADEKRNQAKRDSKAISPMGKAVAGVICVAVLVGTFALYIHYGAPGYQDMPYASRDIRKERILANGGNNMAEEIAMLQQRLQQNPKDIAGWMMLGRTLRTVGRTEESLDAFANALKESDRHPAVLADYAEAKIYANEGAVDEGVVEALMEALQKDPLQFKARFYMGYAKARIEDFEGALQTWVDLQAMAPPEAPWLEQVETQIDMALQASGLDLADFKPSDQAQRLSSQLKLEWEAEAARQREEAARTQPGPSREQMEAVAEMTPEEREAMIRSMVQRLADRLAENPDDLAGWQRLAQVYQVLGETEKAAHARAQVEKLEAGM